MYKKLVGLDDRRARQTLNGITERLDRQHGVLRKNYLAHQLQILWTSLPVWIVAVLFTQMNELAG